MSSSWPTAVTFADSWQAAVDIAHDSTFLIFEGADGTSHEWTYGEFDDVVARCAGFLADRNVVAGDAVHLALTNSPAFVALWLATIRLGAWLVPSDPMSAAPELAEHIERTKPRIGFCSPARSGTYRAAAPAELTVIEIEEADTTLDVFGEQRTMDWPSTTLMQRAAVMFTSGRHEATHASLVAAPIRMILARGNQRVDGTLLEHCWYGMNISHQQYDAFAGLLGCRPRQLYGMTETVPAVLCEAADETDTLTLGNVTGDCQVDVHGGEIVVGSDLMACGNLVINVGEVVCAVIDDSVLESPDLDHPRIDLQALSPIGRSGARTFIRTTHDGVYHQPRERDLTP